MEGLNTEIFDMIDELQMRQYSGQDMRVPEKDKYGYPFEPMDMFSTEPLGFLEMAMRLQTEMILLFNLGQRLNRNSPIYIKVSGQMERMVSQLGSCCITIAVLEQHKEEHPELCMLEDLTIDWLRGITAFNFRKCYAAFLAAHDAYTWKLSASDLSLRWSALDKRLQATAEKIAKIRSGKLHVDLRPASSEGSETKASGSENAPVEAAFSEKAPAFPIDKSAVREAAETETPDIPVSVPDAVFGPYEDPDDEDDGMFGSVFSGSTEGNVPDWLIRRIMDSYVKGRTSFSVPGYGGP